MPVRHVVLFDFKPDASAQQVAAAIARLNTLPGRIPEIRSWTIEEDIGKRDGSLRFALIAGFDDLPAVDRYLAHPDHVAAVNAAAPILDKVAEHDHTTA